MLQAISCRVGRHRWGVVDGDNWGAYRSCTCCGKTKRLGEMHPVESHDHLDLSL